MKPNWRRAFVMGYRRARRKARAELSSIADEIEALQEDFHEIELELHRDRALDEAIVERTTTDLLH
jgi:hypothetical protein